MTLPAPRFKGEFSSANVALLLGVFLAAVYCLTYLGTFTVDDEHILASRAISLAFDGSLNDERVLGNSRIYAYSQLPEQQAQPGLNIEPLQAVLGTGLVHLSLLAGTGRVQSLFLLNLWATALTGISVYLGVCSLGYTKKTAVVTALLFGLGTQAWPYTRTFFRDPLAMAFLSMAWAGALHLRGPQNNRTRWLAWAGLITGTCLGILSKNTVALAIPSLLYLLLPVRGEFGSTRVFFRKYWVFILPAVLILGLFIALAEGAFARFNIRYYLELANFFLTSPHPHLLKAILGPLVSPGKSIFLYSPVLLLSFIGLFLKRKETFAAWLYALLLVLAQGLFYDQNWWGSVNWGLRFFLPAIPLLLVGAAPLIEMLFKKTSTMALVMLLAIVSILLQLAGSLAPVRGYYLDLAGLAPNAAGTLGIWTLKYSAILWHFRWIMAGNAWDLATGRVGITAIPVLMVLAVLAILALVRLYRPRRWFGIVLAVSLAFLTVWMLTKYRDDPAYYPERSDLAAAQITVEQRAAPNDGLVLASYGTPAWYFWMNWGNAEPAWISLPFAYSPDPSAAVPPGTQAILDLAAKHQQNIWLLLPCDSPNSLNLLENRAVLGFGKPLTDDIFQDGNCNTHLLYYPIP